MAILGLSSQLRALREAKFKLGYIKRGKKFPSDTDVFVGKLGDGITSAMIAAYGATPIPDAQESGVYSFGRELRGILKFDFDARADGREVTYESLNRAWGQSRIRCSGDGGDGGEFAGEAWVRDKRFAERLERAGLLRGERADGSGWHAVCKGRDCPLWHSAAADDKMPSCHRETRFRFVLLTPSAFASTADLDDQAPDYLKNLGWVEIATGSWHGTIDIQSGMRTIQAETGGRTQFIPFTLKRVMRSISSPTGRVSKATLMVTYDTDEVQVMAAGGGALAQLRPAQRARIAELRSMEASVAALTAPTYKDVADIQPQPDRRALPSGRPHATPASDRDQALDRAAMSPGVDDDPGEDDPVPTAGARLGQAERDELKRLCGGVEDANGRFFSLERFRSLVVAAYQALGVPQAPPGDMTLVELSTIPEPDRGSWSWLSSVHAEWIRAHVNDTGDDGRDPDEQPAEPTQGELLEARA